MNDDDKNKPGQSGSQPSRDPQPTKQPEPRTGSDKPSQERGQPERR